MKLKYQILTLCTGNICRSPIAEFSLSDKLLGCEVSSAGLQAVVGNNVDKSSAMAASNLGLQTRKHIARQFTWKIGAASDIILVMDRGHLDKIRQIYPDFSAKCFLLRHYCGGGDVPDPYKLGLANHYRAVELIIEASDDWVKKLLKEE